MQLEEALRILKKNGFVVSLPTFFLEPNIWLHIARKGSSTIEFYSSEEIGYSRIVGSFRTRGLSHLSLIDAIKICLGPSVFTKPVFS